MSESPDERLDFAAHKVTEQAKERLLSWAKWIGGVATLVMTITGINLYTTIQGKYDDALQKYNERLARLDEEIQTKVNGKASIIVLPLGGGGSLSPEYQERFQLARNQGILVIVPAGNNGQAETTSFAQSSDVLVVGSTDREGRRATFSNYGRSVELAAPGSQILSNTLDEKLQYSSGGSFSCALAGGVAALVRSVNPQLSPSEVEDVLRESATPIPNAQLGAGQIDAAAAVTAAKNN